jgi:hypothetical protein
VADRYTSKIALVLGEPLDDLGAVVSAAKAAKDIDRASPVRGSESEAQEVHWGGRMQRAVVRQLTEDGRVLVRTEAYLGDDGLVVGLQRQARLLQALTRQLPGAVVGVRDQSAMVDRDVPWVNRLTIGAVVTDDGIVPVADGEGTRWVRTHGAARFDIPDLELYGLNVAQVGPAIAALAHVQEQLLRGGLKAHLSLPDGTAVRLVPVLEAWTHVPLDWPGVGRAGVERGPGLDGPRASLSILHPPRLGRYKVDLAGVVRRLGSD